ncbi:MAG: peptidoglycan DD-metalloendopeptidase family protein [Crocinitomix sp.]|nr:peptidoglycan DD-metalloendopeptidase family protein [Crocinitomix sp.]
MILLAASPKISKTQVLTIPIKGVYGVDYIIVNYPDWHADDGPVLVEDGFKSDHNNGSKTYDGHQGTDFVISGFPQMDSSVYVMAADAGKIIHVTDGLFDRETDGIKEYGLGNYIGIYHPSSNTYSYYGHLKTNSVIVKVGEVVSAGQTIAEVGSSGNSTDPHLHFELWKKGVLSDPAIDPWGMSHDSGSARWKSPPTYDDSYAVWESGFVNYDSVENFVPATWFPLRERSALKSNFNNADPFFTFWALQYGLKVGDKTSIKWYEPNGDLYASESTSYLTQDWWFHYYNHSIPTPPLSKQGVWNILFYYNDTLQLTKSFSYGHLTNKEKQLKIPKPIIQNLDKKTILIILPDDILYNELKLYNLEGKLLLKERLSGLKEVELSFPNTFESGTYIVAIGNDKTRHILKVFIE